jgi:phosphoglycolate phosphatase
MPREVTANARRKDGRSAHQKPEPPFCVQFSLTSLAFGGGILAPWPMRALNERPLVKGLVFDLDGTLVDSLVDIASSVNGVLVRHGRFPRTPDEFRQLVGWGLGALVASATVDQPFSASETEVVLAELREDYRRHPVESTLYPGIEALVEAFWGRIPLGVLSNKDHAMTLQVVGALLAREKFRSVIGAQHGVPHKPDPTSLLRLVSDWGIAPAETLYLGDSNVDIETAKRAGLIACGAAWGFRGRQELVDAGADFVFEDVSSFRIWLETTAIVD